MERAMTEAKLIERYEFKSPINMEGSWGQRPVADETGSVMELYYYPNGQGFIEWEIPEFELFENIGLTFEFDPEGKRTLVDYDGVMTIPDQALDLLEKHGVNVTEMRRTMES